MTPGQASSPSADALDGVLPQRSVPGLHPGYDPAAEEEKKFDPASSTFKYDVEIDVGKNSPIRATRMRAPTPVTPKDFFSGFNDLEADGGDSNGGDSNGGDSDGGDSDGGGVPGLFSDFDGASISVVSSNARNSSSDSTVPRNNTTPQKHPQQFESYPSPSSTPVASSSSPPPTPLRPPQTPSNVGGLSSDGFLFSPLSPSMTRGYSFAYTPSHRPAPRAPTDEDIDRMSPLQRTYTALKMRRGEDPGVRRMRELIENATG